jgi:DNA-binding MarR family transcriptional regulator
MEKKILDLSSFQLWLLIGKVNYSIFLARQRELNRYSIPVRQLHVLRAIHDLGSKATLSEVARRVERETHWISRQAISMEKDGLITRSRDIPKSKILKLELTETGLRMVKIASRSKTIDAALSVLNKQERRQLASNLNKILVNLEET